MPATAKGSGHRPRVMVALRPAVYEKLTELADRNRRPASWQLHAMVLEALVAAEIITPEESEALWDDVTGRS